MPFSGRMEKNKSRPGVLSHANYVRLWQVSLISETFVEPEMLFHLSTLSTIFMNICPKWLFYLEQNHTYCGGPWNLYHPSPAVKQFIPDVTVWIWNALPQAASSTLVLQQLFPGGWRLWEIIGGRSMELANSVHFLPYALIPSLLWREQTDTYSCSRDSNHSLCLPCQGRWNSAAVREPLALSDVASLRYLVTLVRKVINSSTR